MGRRIADLSAAAAVAAARYDARHRARRGQRALRQAGGSPGACRRRGRRAGAGHHPRGERAGARRGRRAHRGQSRCRRVVRRQPAPLPARRRPPPPLLNSCRTRCAATIPAKASRRPCAIPPRPRRPRPTSPLRPPLPLPRRPARRGGPEGVRGRENADTATSTWIWIPNTDSAPPPPEEPRVSASTRGAGPMGFSGTAPKSDAPAAGLTRCRATPSAADPSARCCPRRGTRHEEQPDDGEERNKP